MTKRIIFTVCNQGDGTKPMTAEESWYWRRPERDIAECGFWVQGKERGIELMNFFVPREITELFASPGHWTGQRIKIRDEMLDWQYVNSIDCAQYINRWPRTTEDLTGMYKTTAAEIETHKKTLLSGWLKLVCVSLRDSIPDIAYQLPFFENYLQEELMDFHWMYNHIKQVGGKAALSNPRDGRNFQVWLKIASCNIELLSEVCPTILAILKIDKGQTYPYLHAGYQWMKHHHLGSWDKVKNLIV